MSRRAIWLFLLVLCIGTRCTVAQLVYRFTVRDFLPCACMRGNEIDNYWFNNTQMAFNPKRISDSNFCPIRQDILEGTYSGHPDFEPHPKLYANGCSGERNSMLADPSVPNFTLRAGGEYCQSPEPEQKPVTRIVLNYMEYDTSGVPKPVYCSKGNGPFNTFYFTDKRCGWHVGAIPSANALVSTTGEPMFNLWFRDNPKYSKRVGSKRTMVPVLGRPGEFVYDSGVAGFHPVDDHPACLAIGGRLNCTNGGKVFPKSLLEGNTHWDLNDPFVNEAQGKSFAFTAEIHSFFTFKGTESFTFSGDDDVWVFLNERLAVDVGGLHSPNNGTINLSLQSNQHELRLEIGKTYALDVFMAERHSDESNFKITTSLSPGCNVENSAKFAYSWNPATAQSDWKLIGGPSWAIFNSNKALKLLDRTAYGTSSYAFLRQQVNVGTGFIASFIFQASTHTGEGFVFVIQRDRITDLNGGSGGNLGLANMKKSIGIVFDFCADRETNYPNCTGREIRMHYGNLTLDESNSARRDSATRNLWQPLYHPNQLADGKNHTVTIKYYSKSPDWIDVFVDDDLFLQKRNVDIERIIGGRNAWIGFTGSTGPTIGSDVFIHDMKISAVSLEDSNTEMTMTYGPGINSTVVAKADGREVVNFTIQTRDFCTEKIEFGGFAQRAKGLMWSLNDTTQENTTVNATVIDRGDGRYTYEFRSTVPGNYSFEFLFGEACFSSAPGGSGCFRFARNSMVVFEPFFPATPAPFPIEEDDPVPLRFYLGAGITSGILAVLGGIALVFFVRIRNQWRREEPFIKAGKMAAMERDIQYEGDEQIDLLQRQLQETLTTIQKEKARTGYNNREMNERLQHLLKEKGELQELVRRLKLKAKGVDDVAQSHFTSNAHGESHHQPQTTTALARVSRAFRSAFNRESSSNRLSRRMSSLSNRASRILDSINPGFFRRATPTNDQLLASVAPATSATKSPVRPVPPVPPKPPQFPMMSNTLRSPPPLPDI